MDDDEFKKFIEEIGNVVNRYTIKKKGKTPYIFNRIIMPAINKNRGEEK